MKICYVPKRFNRSSRELIDHANTIIADYQRQGYELTLRQLYYQFVSRGIIANKDTEYDRLGSVINDARLAGEVSWNSIVDRTRNLVGGGYDSKIEDHIASIADWFTLDRWRGQQYRPEVWVEKDALVGVVARAANAWQVPYFSCRGYTSQSEMWTAGQRLLRRARGGQTPIVIHLGDHDPSGIDMSRDIADRLSMFTGRAIEVRRIALNMDQIQQYDPPPNPAKLSDSRGMGYVSRFGYESWELDALEPAVINQLITDQLEGLVDRAAMDDIIAEEDDQKRKVKAISDNIDDIVTYLEDQELL